MLNAEMWAKIAKAVITVGAVAGIQIEPEQLELMAASEVENARVRNIRLSDKLDRQLIKYKEKQVDHHRGESLVKSGTLD